MSLLARHLSRGYLQDAYKAGLLTPESVVEEIIKRANQSKHYNIWIAPPSRVLIDPYLARLGAADSVDFERYPLWGVPFAVKDNIDVCNYPTTAGCPAFSYMPDLHATVVGKLINAGAFPIGKTNLDQFATGLVGTRSPYGECHNALRSELISGGSSSGSAVAVALGQSAFSLGTDTAGSGRVPAALNGIIGFKPPIGSWSTKGIVPACESLDCVTAFTTTLDDAVMIDRCVSGFDRDCIWSRVLEKSEEPVSPLTLLFPQNPPTFFGSFALQYQRQWKEFCSRVTDSDSLQTYAIHSIDMTLFDKVAAILYEGPWVAERWEALGSFVENNPGATFGVTEKVLRSGADPLHTASELFKTLHFLKAARSEVQRLLKQAILILPTTGGTFTRNQIREDPFATNSLLGLYTNHCNLLDLCALALPVGETKEDLPFGVSLFSLYDEQHNLFHLASAFERSLGKQ